MIIFRFTIASICPPPPPSHPPTRKSPEFPSRVHHASLFYMSQIGHVDRDSVWKVILGNCFVIMQWVEGGGGGGGERGRGRGKGGGGGERGRGRWRGKGEGGKVTEGVRGRSS